MQAHVKQDELSLSILLECFNLVIFGIHKPADCDHDGVSDDGLLHRQTLL